jgi:hypothetical protein
MKITANPSLILFHAAFFWRCLSMMRRHYVHSYGASGAQSRYRIRLATTPRICSDVRKAGRWGLSLETQQPLPPWPPCPYQFGALPLQLRLKPRPIGVAVGQNLQFIEP